MSNDLLGFLKDASKGNLKPIKGNPRKELAKHRERGPKLYTYSIEDVSALTGLAIQTLRNRAKEWNGSLSDTISFVINNTK